MDFQKLLLEAGKELSKDEVKALAFLCTDILRRSYASVESASDLFSRLADRDLLSAEKPHLLNELLLIINRQRLIRDLQLTNHIPATKISPYRKLLYNLSEDLTDDDLRNVKFLLNKDLPRRKLEDHVNTLEVFLELEHMDLISDSNVDLLETIVQQVCPMLKDKIEQFKAQQGPRTGPVAQETSRPRSNTYPSERNQIPPSFGRTCSNEIQEPPSLAESTLYYSNTSIDECEALSQDLSGLNIETRNRASSQVRSDAVVMTSHENDTFSGTVMSPPTNTNTVLDIQTYSMTAAKRGVCLIVNNYDFTKSKNNLTKREGTAHDESSLRKVFTWLSFDVVIHNDLRGEALLSTMQELGGRDHRQMDCLVCFILSHGKEGDVYGVDGESVSIRELIEPFNGVKCPSLAGKPKLFFIQACQGKCEQNVVYIEADGPGCSLLQSDAVEMRHSIPHGADILLGMATVPSYVSYRERNRGTWFIQSLCQNLVKMVPRNSDLLSILIKVNADVAQKTDPSGLKKQMPQPTFSLTKKVVFPIPKASPPRL